MRIRRSIRGGVLRGIALAFGWGCGKEQKVDSEAVCISSRAF